MDSPVRPSEPEGFKQTFMDAVHGGIEAVENAPHALANYAADVWSHPMNHIGELSLAAGLLGGGAVAGIARGLSRSGMFAAESSVAGAVRAAESPMIIANESSLPAALRAAEPPPITYQPNVISPLSQVFSSDVTQSTVGARAMIAGDASVYRSTIGEAAWLAPRSSVYGSTIGPGSRLEQRAQAIGSELGPSVNLRQSSKVAFADIGEGAQIGEGVQVLGQPEARVHIGSNAVLASRVELGAGVRVDSNPFTPTTIGPDVIVVPNTRIPAGLQLTRPDSLPKHIYFRANQGYVDALAGRG